MGDEDNSDENDIDDGDDNGNDSEDEVGVKEKEKDEFIEATASAWSQEEVKNHSREAVDEGERARDNEEPNLRKKISSMNINPSLDETKPSKQDDSINCDAEEEHDME